MCGIAGYFGVEKIPAARIYASLELMRRRGPDRRDHREFQNVQGRTACLLHSRLSIIDLDPRSSQPFIVGSKSIVYNGELYNYREIRCEVERTGYSFRTESDTEVLLAAIDRLGWDVLDRCEGMWSLAVYDESDGSLTLCRDRFGEKPLYVLTDRENLYFGSEPKMVACLRGRSLDINEQHLRRYMVNGYKSLYKEKGQTFFRGLSEIPPAYIVRFDADGHRTDRPYWTPKCDIDASMSYEDAVEGARERLFRAVELRLRADVPIAFCMSGGVDSNSLISIAKRVFDYDVHGFTIVNTDSRYEEQDVVLAAVKELGVKHTQIPVKTDRFLPQLRKLIQYHDAPIYTISYYAHWLLMQAVSEHGYRISVSGTAADELFTGYFDHHNLYLHDVHGTETHAAALADWQAHTAPIVRNPHLQRADLYLSDPRFRDHIYLNADTFANYLTEPFAEPFRETDYSEHLLRSRMMNELFEEATPVILHEDDLNAMYFSIENRSPFLDRELCDFAYSIPTRHLMRNGYAKSVLRDAVRGVAPDDVVNNRRKVGFNAPVFSFLDIKDESVIEQLLDESPIFEHVRRESVEQLIKKPQLANSESKFLFYFLCSKIFLEEFGCSMLKQGKAA
jgi:asparagine synthase (glutamine-hydrolysing)